VNVNGLLTSAISGGTVSANTLSSSSITGGTITSTSNASITTLNGGNVTVGGIATIGTLTSGTANLNGATASISTLNGGNVALGNTALSVAAGTFAGVISGANGSVTKTGAGTLTLNGANTFGGALNLNGGTIILGNTAAVSSASSLNILSSSTIQYASGITTDFTTHLAPIASGVTLTVNTNGNNETLASTLAGAGNFVKSGTGNLTLSGTSTLSGSLTLNSGTITLASAGALGSATVSVASGATLDLGNVNPTGATIVLNGGSVANTTSYTGSIAFSGTNDITSSASSLPAGVLVTLGAGQSLNAAGFNHSVVYTGGTISGLASFANNLTVQAALDASASGLSTGSVSIANGGVLNLGSLSVNKDITFAGGSLSGTNYTGNLTMSGTVSISPAVIPGSAHVTVTPGDVVSVTDNGLNNAITISGGTLNFGTYTSTAPVSYAGGAITGSGYTGNVSFSGAQSFTAGNLGAGTLQMTTGNTATFGTGFNNAVSYSGGAIVNGSNYTGILTVNNAVNFSAATNLGGTMVLTSGSTLSGVGSVGNVVAQSGSSIKLGTGPGTLNTQNLSFAAGSTYTMQVKDSSAAAGTGYDVTNVAGNLDLSALSSVNKMTLKIVSLDANNNVGNVATQNFAWNNAQSLTLFTFTGNLNLANGVAITDVFSIDASGFTSTRGEAAGSDWFQISANTAGGAIVLTAIPEPSSYGLALAGLAVAAAAIRRRQQKKSAKSAQ